MKLPLLPFATAVLACAQTGATQPQFGPSAYYQIVASNSGGTFIGAADFNRDGRVDIVALQHSSGSVAVLLGDGTGGFSNRILTPLPNAGFTEDPGVAVGDLNSDGCLDLAITRLPGVLILLGDCRGGFSLRTTLTGLNGSNVGGLIVARDINGDSRTDLILSDGSAPHISVFLGNGDGTFSSEITYDKGGTTGNLAGPTMAVADFNNDGFLDIALGIQTPPGLAILVGKGDGTFKSPILLSSGTGPPLTLLATDLNGDRNTDLIFVPVDASVNSGLFGLPGGNMVNIYLGNGNGGFRPLTPFPMGVGTLPLDVEVADLNGDGIPDLAITQNQYLTNPARSIDGWAVLLGKGDGTFASSFSWQAPGVCGTAYVCQYPSVEFILADLNGDKKPDLVFAEGLVRQPDGTFVATLGVALNTTGTAPSIASITNGASNLPGSISPGEIVVILGSGLGPAQLTQANVGADGLVPKQLAATTVQFNGTPAPMIYTWATQVAAIVPYSVISGTAQVTVTYQGQTTAAFSVSVASSAPGVFALDSTGKGQAAAVNQDGSINTPATAAKVGDIISLFVTGEGQTSPAGVDGKPASVPYPHPVLPVGVSIGGQTLSGSQLQYAGGAPGEVAGLMQVNVQIPGGTQTGNAIPVSVQVGGVSSQAGITIAVR